MRRDFTDRSDGEAEIKLKKSWRGRSSLLAVKNQAEMFTNRPSWVYLLIFLILLTTSCSRKAEDPIVLQMRIRHMQSRTFAGCDANTVAKEMIAVLQDEGFMVKSISNDLGLLTAEKDTDIEKFSSKFWSYVFSGRNARWNKHSVLEMTSNITEEKGRTKIRVNFLVRIFDNLGRVVDVHQVLEDDAYINFFNKVQKGLISRGN